MRGRENLVRSREFGATQGNLVQGREIWCEVGNLVQVSN